MDDEYKQTPFNELEWWLGTFKQEKTLGSSEEARVIQQALGKQVLVFDPQNAATNFKKLARDATWGAHLAVVYHTVVLRPRNRIRTQGQAKGLKQDGFFRYVAATLPYMRNVKELILLDSNVDPPAVTAMDLFNGNADMQLETLWCDSEALLAKCWASLCDGGNLIKLQDFRGFCDPHQPPPSRITPPISPWLKFLETSAHFADRLQGPWGITNLCIHVEWGELPSILKKISTLPGLSDQLHALRLNCHTAGVEQQQQQPAGSGTTLPGRKISPLAVQWPRIVCRNLNARVLNYARCRTVQRSKRTRSVSERPPQEGWNRHTLSTTDSLAPRLERSSLQKIVDFLAIALDRNIVGPWRVFTRDRRLGRIEDAERAHAINELSWKVTEWEDAKGIRQWHWPQSSRLFAQEATIS